MILIAETNIKRVLKKNKHRVHETILQENKDKYICKLLKSHHNQMHFIPSILAKIIYTKERQMVKKEDKEVRTS